MSSSKENLINKRDFVHFAAAVLVPTFWRTINISLKLCEFNFEPKPLQQHCS